jgi:ribonuclease BN (tRNA processing enzyme)
VTFHDVPHEPWEIEGVRIDAQTVSHPGPTLGYRLSANGNAVAYIPDHEPVLGIRLAELESEWISGHSLAQGVDLLFHDSQFSEQEYPSRVGWGHSSVAHAVEFAQRAEVGRLVLFHHDPDRSDDGVEQIVDRARELWGAGPGDGPIAASEGMTLEVA